MNTYTEEAKAIFPEAVEVPVSITIGEKTMKRTVTAADLRLDYAVFMAKFLKPMLKVVNPKWMGD